MALCRLAGDAHVSLIHDDGRTVLLDRFGVAVVAAAFTVESLEDVVDVLGPQFVDASARDLRERVEKLLSYLAGAGVLDWRRADGD